MSGGFLVGIIAVVLAIILAAPQYAEPALSADLEATESPVPSFDPEAEEAALTIQAPPTSKPPNKLRGYVWPVRGGMIDTYYAPDRNGDFVVDGVRIHDGLVITWFKGAMVKAAHKGVVVAAGRDWARHVGFDGSLDDVYERYKPKFPMGIVIDDGNGYYSVYTELEDLLVKPGQKVERGQPIGHMSKAEKKQMMRYRLVRMDGPLMRVHDAARQRGYPGYARERVDPLAVLGTGAKRMPQMRRKPPKDPPRLSDY